MNIELKLFLLSVLISVSNLSFAVDNGTWTYEINSDGTSITLTGTTDYPPPNLIIPKIIDDYNVTITNGLSIGEDNQGSFTFSYLSDPWFLVFPTCPLQELSLVGI